MAENFVLDLIGALDKDKSTKQINRDIKQLQKVINMLRITGTFAKDNTKRELNSYIKSLQSKLNYVKLKGQFDGKNLKKEVDKALNNVSFKDIGALNIDGSKTLLKLRKIIADARAYADKNSVSINVNMKREKLNNDLTAYLTKNSKIRESSILLEEADKVRDLIGGISDKKSLENATEAFQLFKSEVSATGYATKSTTEKIKNMLSSITKIGSFFGVASLAINNFKKSLQTLKSNDTILVEISKTSEMTTKQIKQLGDEAFKTASKYGQLSSNYLLGVQEMARSGYEETSKELAELSLLAQSAGNMTADNANSYLLATDAAYKYGGSIKALSAALDGANYISNKNSANLTDIADAISVSASFAANAGVAIDELTAAEATMIATTKRSGSEIGRSFRSIILNLQQVSGEFDGEVIDEEQLKKVEARCHSLGVELEYMKDGVATLRNPIEVLRELAEVYNSLPDSSADKQGLISDLGGKYHANALSALLSQWDMYEKMLDEYSQGTGSALEEAEKTADSWEGRLNSLQNSWDSFVNSLTNKDAIMGGISFFDRLIQSAEQLTDIFGEIPVLLTAINASMVAMNKDYGITQLFNKETRKLDVQGNIFGINISQIKEQKKHFAEAEKAIAGWNNKLLQGQIDINDFNESVVQNNAQLKAYLATTSKDAPASLDGYKSYLNEAGIATDALRLKTVLLNAAISFGIGFAIQKTVEVIDNIAHSVEKCKERVDKLMSSHKSAIDAANSNANRVEELAEKYESLSKGVNDLGENVSLTTEEYREYNSIVNEIADMFPALVKGYTDEGNAILNLKGNVEQLRDAYKEAQQEAYNMLIVSGKDTDGNDIIKNWNNLNDTGFWKKIIDYGGDDVGYGISTTEAINLLKQVRDLSLGEYANLAQDLTAGEIRYLSKTFDSGMNFFMSEENFANAKRQAKVLVQTHNAEIQSALKDVETLANAYLMTNEDYAKLDEQSKNAASIVVNSLNTNIASSFTSKEDVGAYVDKIVQTILTNTDVKDALIGLFTMDTTDKSIDDAANLVNQYIRTISNILEEDPLELKVRLGFEDIDTLEDNYLTMLNDVATRVSGIDFSDPFFEPRNVTEEQSLKYSEIYHKIDEFAKQYSINTQDEIAAFRKALDEANYDIDKAFEKYLENLDDKGANETPDLSKWFESNKDPIDDFQSKLKTLGDTLSSIRSGNFEDSDLTDLLQEFPELAYKTDDLETAIVELINNALQALYNTLGEEIPDGLKTSLQDLADIASGTAKHLGDAFSNIHDSWDILHDFKETMDKGFDSNVTDSLLQSVRGLSGELETLVAGYYSGVVTAEQLYEALTEHYENDLHNYSEALIKKNELNETFYNAVGLADTEVVNQFNDNYGVDLENCKTYAEAKAQIELDTLDTISTAWSKYYDAQSKTFTREYKILEAQATHGGGVPAELLEEINSKVADYEAAMEALNSITYDGIKSNFNGISTKLNGDTSSDSKEAKDSIDAYMTHMEESLKSGRITYQDYTRDVASYLKKMYDSGKLSAKEYFDYDKQMLETQKSIYDKVLSAVTRRIDKEIDHYQDLIDALEEENDALNAKKDEYDSILSVVESVYDKEIERIKEQQDAIDDTIKKLREENDENRLNMELEQARWNLYKSLNQRNVKLYNGTEYVYQTNRDEVRQNQQNLADLELEQTISALEKERDALDESIDLLEEYKQKWLDIADAHKNAINEQLAKDLFGEQYEQFILQNRLSDIDDFKNKYLAIQDKIDDNTQMIESYKEKVEYYNRLKDQWNEIADVYEQSVEDQYAAMLLGQQWEEDVISGRLQTLNNFKDQYVQIQQAIVDAAWKSANEQNRASQAVQSGTTGSPSSVSSGTGSSASNGSSSTNTTAEKTYQIQDIDTGSILFSGTESQCNGWIPAHNYTKVKTATNGNVVTIYARSNNRVTSSSSSGSGSTANNSNAASKNVTQAQLYHSGLDEGYVGTKEGTFTEDQKLKLLQYFGKEVHDGEVPAVLQESELVLTPLQRDNVLQNMAQYAIKSKSADDLFGMSSMSVLMGNNKAEKVDNSTRTIIHNNNMTFPNVTNDKGAEEVLKAINQLTLDAKQYASKRK